MTAIFVAHFILTKRFSLLFNFSNLFPGGTDIETYMETLRTNDA